MTPHVLITRRLEPEVVASLEGLATVDMWPHDSPMPQADLAARGRDADYVVCTISDTLGPEFFAGTGRLRGVSSISAGLDHVDLDAARAHGVRVTNTPGTTRRATAEIAVLLILMAARNAVGALEGLRRGEWEDWRLWQWCGLGLAGRRLGVVGLGDIGAAVAVAAEGLGMRIAYTNTSGPRAGHPGWEWLPFEALLRQSDVVTVHVPLTAGTRGLLGAREFATMPRGAIVVNTSRGPVVDEGALLAALDSGHLHGAGLDVYGREPVAPDDPLVRHPRAVCLPHIGSATFECRGDMVATAMRNLHALIAGG